MFPRFSRVCRAPVLRRFDALRNRVVRQQKETRLSDFAAGNRRLRGRDKALTRRSSAESPKAQSGVRVRWFVRRHVGRLVPHEVSRRRWRVSVTRDSFSVGVVRVWSQQVSVSGSIRGVIFNGRNVHFAPPHRPNIIMPMVDHVYIYIAATCKAFVVVVGSRDEPQWWTTRTVMWYLYVNHRLCQRVICTTNTALLSFLIFPFDAFAVNA